MTWTSDGLIAAAAAAFVTVSLFVPTTSVAAHEKTIVRNGRGPVTEGSGRALRQTRAIGNFQSVEAAGAETVEVRVGLRPSLVISADDNILPLIITEVRNGKLRIGSRASYRTRTPIRVWLTTPALDGYTSVGSGDATITGINSSRLALTLTGSGDIRAQGRVGSLAVTVNGSGRANLSQLTADRVEVAIHGSGDATVNASRKLGARVFGSGTVRYLGRPAEIDRQRFGSGQIVAAR